MSFSVGLTDPFLKAFYYFEKLNEILRKNSREGFEKPYVAQIGVGGQKLPKS